MTRPPAADRVATVPRSAHLPEPVPRRPKVRWAIAAVAAASIGAGIALAAMEVRGSSTRSPSAASPVSDNSFPTALASIQRRTISQRTSVPATLGYAGSDAPINQASGFYTELPAVGQIVTAGQVLYRVDGNPVVLLYGPTPRTGRWRRARRGPTSPSSTPIWSPSARSWPAG